MAAKYEVYICDAVGEILDSPKWFSLSYTRSVAGIGGLELTLNGTYPLSNVKVDGRILVYRNGLLEIDSPWFIRKWEKQLGADGERTLTVYGVSANEILTRRIVAYASGASQASKTDYPDNLMKAIVRENFGSSASDANRNISAYLSIEPDASRGISLSKSFSRDNVFGVCQEITQSSITAGSAVYFDVVSTTSSRLEFRTYPTLRGINHTFPGGINPVTLSPGAGLSNVTLSFDRSQETTFAYAAGTGVESNRLVYTACSLERINESPFNRREALRDVSNVSSSATLIDEAGGEVRAGRPVRIFEGEMVNVPGTCEYRVHWSLGDAVTVSFDGDSFNCTIDSVSVTVQGSNEEITGTLRVEEN